MGEKKGKGKGGYLIPIRVSVVSEPLIIRTFGSSMVTMSDAVLTAF